MTTWYIAAYDVNFTVGPLPRISATFDQDKRVMVKGEAISSDDLPENWQDYNNDDALIEVDEATAAQSHADAMFKLDEERRGHLGDNQGVVSWNSPWFRT